MQNNGTLDHFKPKIYKSSKHNTQTFYFAIEILLNSTDIQLDITEFTQIGQTGEILLVSTRTRFLAKSKTCCNDIT